MKVAFITTINHNVGDDFVRDGIRHLLARAVGPAAVEPRLIHKHFPASVRPEWEWLHQRGCTRLMDRVPGLRARRWSRWIERLPLRAATDKILTADLVVQSGAPVYWLNAGSDSSRNEWHGPLIRRRWLQVRDRVPLLNLGAGACQPFYSDGSEFKRAPAVRDFIREFHAQCALTTVRDQLSRTILAQEGIDAVLLPCPALLAPRLHQLGAGTEARYIALNFMRLGGHYQLGGADNSRVWRERFVAFARGLAMQARCLLVCHDRTELTDAEHLLPEIERFYSADYRDYLRIYAQASCGVVNRVHAAFAMAGCGRPSLVIGNDSRARMAEVLGLPVLHVAEATAEQMKLRLQALQSAAAEFSLQLGRTADAAEQAYLQLLQPVLAPRSPEHGRP